jgi:DNA-binding NtrC family response regulator
MGGPSVLLVDDDAGMVETLADILAAHHCRVNTASSGEAALAMVREGHYDLVLMDIQMPRVNGVEALQAMRALAPRMPVVMMTAFTRHELTEEAARAGAGPVLSKPLEIERVLALVDQATRAHGDP